MESNNLLRHKIIQQWLYNQIVRPFVFEEMDKLYPNYVPREKPDPNYVPRETEVIESPSDIQLLKRICKYKDDGSVAWQDYVDQDGNEWVKREDVEDY